MSALENVIVRAQAGLKSAYVTEAMNRRTRYAERARYMRRNALPPIDGLPNDAPRPERVAMMDARLALEKIKGGSSEHARLIEDMLGSNLLHCMMPTHAVKKDLAEAEAEDEAKYRHLDFEELDHPEMLLFTSLEKELHRVDGGGIMLEEELGLFYDKDEKDGLEVDTDEIISGGKSGLRRCLDIWALADAQDSFGLALVLDRTYVTIADADMPDHRVVGEGKSRTALQIACQQGYMHCALVLLQRGCRLNLRDEDGKSALELACHQGRLKCCELLLAFGATVTAHMRLSSTSIPQNELPNLKARAEDIREARSEACVVRINEHLHSLGEKKAIEATVKPHSLLIPAAEVRLTKFMRMVRPRVKGFYVGTYSAKNQDQPDGPGIIWNEQNGAILGEFKDGVCIHGTQFDAASNVIYHGCFGANGASVLDPVRSGGGIGTLIFAGATVGTAGGRDQIEHVVRTQLPLLSHQQLMRFHGAWEQGLFHGKGALSLQRPTPVRHAVGPATAAASLCTLNHTWRPLYKGTFKFGYFHGAGTLWDHEVQETSVVRYRGCFSMGLPSGRGTRYFGDKDNEGRFPWAFGPAAGFIEGTFIAGLAHGHCTVYYPNSSHAVEPNAIYLKGMLQGGKAHGKVTVFRRDGSVMYKGSAKLGMPDGFGTLIETLTDDQIEYRGAFSSGKAHGIGSVKTASGSEIQSAAFHKGVVARVVTLNEWGEAGVGALFRVLLAGKKHAFKDMIKNDPGLVTSRSPGILGGDSAAHVAAAAGNIGALMMLASMGVLNTALLNARGQTAMDIARQEGNTACENFLLLL